MRKLGMTLGKAAAAAACAVGSLTMTPLAAASDVAPPPPAPITQAQPSAPPVQLFDCRGTTGAMGCGPGWIWRDGWRGMACYPC
jgi:hypothetical protein